MSEFSETTLSSLSGWFDNQATQCRELWCSGILRCSWPVEQIQAGDGHAPWRYYPDLPQGLRRFWGFQGLESVTTGMAEASLSASQ